MFIFFSRWEQIPWEWQRELLEDLKINLYLNTVQNGTNQITINWILNYTFRKYCRICQRLAKKTKIIIEFSIIIMRNFCVIIVYLWGLKDFIQYNLYNQLG